MVEAASSAKSGERSLRAFTDALNRGRLAHAILVHGDHAAALETACLCLAGKLLNVADPARHPDFFALRPEGKARFIKVDALREFIRKIQLTAAAGPRKVGVVYEADRMMPPTANAFLKTLEEPPDGTTLFLLTTRPNDLLPTIRSRCFHLRLPAASAPLADEGWRAWLADYAAWLGQLAGGGSLAGDKTAACGLVLGAYGLGARFENTLHRLADTAWEEAKLKLPAGLEDEELEAAQSGLQRGVRDSLLVELEQATRDFALAKPNDPAIAHRAARLARGVADLEKISGLLKVNLNDAAALEYFLLRSLRHWTAKH
jgi:DNA polymerase-3 subunit delta'